MKKNANFIIVSIVNLLLLAVGAGFNVIGIIKNDPLQYILNIVAIIFAILYCFVGYKKKGNLYFRLFCGFLALKEIAAIMHIIRFEAVPLFTYLLLFICYSCVLLLACGKDLGKKVSYGLVITLIVLSALALVFVIINTNYLSVVIYDSTRLLLALPLGIMVHFKYLDKASRNTK